MSQILLCGFFIHCLICDKMQNNKGFYVIKYLIIIMIIFWNNLIFSYSYKNDKFIIENNRVIEIQKHGSKIESGYNQNTNVLYSNYYKKTKTLSVKTMSQYPKFKCHSKLIEALYNMSLNELEQDINKKGFFIAGAKWNQAWTRDMSYAIFLSLAMISPTISKASLDTRVYNGKILQDTGSGGSYPISSDRMIWALAAFEVAKVIDKKEYYKNIYTIIKNSMQQDLILIYDKNFKLFTGEESFLDWREQTYPKWCTPKDIGQSFALNTNIVHLMALQVLNELSQILNASHEDMLKWTSLINDLQQSINSNFYNDFGYYSAYILSNPIYRYDGYETLGESLSILSGLTDDSNILTAIQESSYGMSVVAPQLKNIFPYHNKSIWPFVQSYRCWAAARYKRVDIAKNIFAYMTRAGSMFLTNKENISLMNGSYKGTAINSDRQLWSVAGYLSLIYRTLFGIEYQKDGLLIRPCKFDSFVNDISLTDFKFYNAILNITIKGTGADIVSYKLNGKTMPNDYILPKNIQGRNKIEIIVKNNNKNSITISQKYSYNCLDSTEKIINVNAIVKRNTYFLEFNNKKKKELTIYKNNKKYATTTKDKIKVKAKEFADCYYIVNNKNNLPSLPSNKIWTETHKNTFFYECEDYNGKNIKIIKTNSTNAKISYYLDEVMPNGNGYIRLLDNNKFDFLVMNINVESEGDYILDFRYQNGHGPINTGEECAIREVAIDKIPIEGVVMFPQLGSWTLWGDSTSKNIHLTKGEHEIKIYSSKNSYSQKDKLISINLDLMRLRKIDH